MMEKVKELAVLSGLRSNEVAPNQEEMNREASKEVLCSK